MNSPFHKTASQLEQCRAWLRRRFSPSRLLRRSDGFRRLAEGGAGEEWVVARGLAAYTVVDASHVPAKLRPGFARTAATRWSPFNDSDFHLEWVGGRAMVWAWSGSRVRDSDGEAGGTSPRRLLPESLLLGQPRMTGAELLATDEGVEGRVWDDYLLASSQWWPQVPALREWNLFRRAAGLAPAPSVPEPLREPHADRAWSAPRALGLGDVVHRYRSIAVATGAGLGVALLAAQLAAALSLVVAGWMVEEEIAAQDSGVQNILDAREAALRDASAVDRLLALRTPGQIELMAAVNELLPAGWQLLDWRMLDPGKLEVVARIPQADPPALVRAWEASGRFHAVTVELGRDAEEISIRAEVASGPAEARAQ